MRIIEVENYEKMSQLAAGMLGAQVLLKPDCVLGLATGSSPIRTYELLAEQCAAGLLDFSQVRTVNLDEYCGLKPDDPQSYRYFMDTNLFDKVNIKKENTYLPNGIAPDMEAEAARYEALVQELGGADLQLLGIGNNGHIAFNEAADVLHATAHIEKLTESTIQANSRFFEKKEDVPTTAITMGMGDILAAKCVVLIATGLAKTDAIRGLVMDDAITTHNPSTMLKMHENVYVVIDQELADAVGYKG